jgi:hypothetical protein
VTSLVPTEDKQVFRLWWGAADANIATGLIKVEVIGEEE